MGYDSPEFKTFHYIGPILGSFASFIGTTGTKVNTSTNVTDRLEFLRNIKATGISLIMRSGAAATARAASRFSYTLKLLNGTATVATCIMGTAAGFGTSGGIKTADIDAAANLALVRRVTGVGTATTHAADSCEVYIEYRKRVAQT